MLCNKRIAVVVPAYNESQALPGVISTMPSFVDRVIVVNDGSNDDSKTLLEKYTDRRIKPIHHSLSRGVGAAIATGYRAALKGDFDVVCVMAGDGQMAPSDLARLIEPIVKGQADYVKGNRFADGLPRSMPLRRLFGNVTLSLINKPVTGYWRIFDSQCGYTAISRAALIRLVPERIYPEYGVPNDILARLSANGERVLDRPVQALYPRHHSHMKLRRVSVKIPFVLARSWGRRVFVQNAAKLRKLVGHTDAD